MAKFAGAAVRRRVRICRFVATKVCAAAVSLTPCVVLQCADTDCIGNDITCNALLLSVRSISQSVPVQVDYTAYRGASSGVYAYSYNESTGALSLAGSLLTVVCNNSLARHPSIPVLYCLGLVGGVTTVQVVSINRGTMSLIQSVPFADANFGGVRVHPQGGYVTFGDATNDQQVVYSVNTDGRISLAYAAGAGTGSAASAFTHGGAYFYVKGVTNIFEYAFSATALTQQGTPFSPGTNVWSLVETRDSRFLYGSTSTANEWCFSIAGGAAANFNGAALACGPPSYGGGAVVLNDTSPDGRFIFYNDQAASATGSLTYSASTGQFTQVSYLAGVLYGSARVSPDGKFLYSNTSTQYDLFTIGSDGTLTRSSDSPITNGLTTQTPIVFHPFPK